MFIGSAIIEHIKGKKNRYKVINGFAYINDKYSISVKNGWITDGASVPRIFWNIASPLSGRYVEAALLHDALYMAEALPRKECDDIFLEAMKELGTPFLKRWIMYLSVRCFGWLVWREHDRRGVFGAKKYIDVKVLQ